VHHAVPGEKAVQGVVGRSSHPSAMTSPGDSSRCSSARFPIFPQDLPFNCGALNVFHASPASSPHSSRSKAARKLTSMLLHVGRCHAGSRLAIESASRVSTPTPESTPGEFLVTLVRSRPRQSLFTNSSVAEPPPRQIFAAAPQPTVHVLGRECRETGHMTT